MGASTSSTRRSSTSPHARQITARIASLLPRRSISCARAIVAAVRQYAPFDSGAHPLQSRRITPMSGIARTVALALALLVTVPVIVAPPALAVDDLKIALVVPLSGRW